MDNASASEVSDGQATTRSSLGEHVERALEDVFAFLRALLKTVVLFGVRPSPAVYHAIRRRRTPSSVVGPYTFLLVGCVFYSYLLGGAGRITDSIFTQVVWTIVKRETVEGFSLERLLVRTLPIVIGTSLFAAAAGALSVRRGTDVRKLFAYLYGLQGIALLLFALSMSFQGSVLMRLIGSDDGVMLVFAAFVVLIAVQGYRSLRLLTARDGDAPKQSRHLLLSAVYPLLFVLPLPLIGYFVVASGLIAQEVRERPEPGVDPVRIVEAKVQLLDRTRIRVTALAVIENRSKYPLALRAEAVVVELHLISIADRETWVFSSEPARRLPSLDYFDRHVLRVGQPRLVTAQQPLVIQTLAPGQAIAVQVTASSEATSTAFLAKRSRDKGHDAHSEARVRLPLPQVERLAQETQPAIRIRVHDATLPPSLRDLQSGYYEAEFESIFNR